MCLKNLSLDFSARCTSSLLSKERFGKSLTNFTFLCLSVSLDHTFEIVGACFSNDFHIRIGAMVIQVVAEDLCPAIEMISSRACSTRAIFPELASSISWTTVSSPERVIQDSAAASICNFINNFEFQHRCFSFIAAYLDPSELNYLYLDLCTNRWGVEHSPLFVIEGAESHVVIWVHRPMRVIGTQSMFFVMGGYSDPCGLFNNGNFNSKLRQIIY